MATNNTDQDRLPTLHEQYFNYIDNYSSNPIRFNKFQPLKPYRICPIHRFTSLEHLMYILQHIHKTKAYSIHTERFGQDGPVVLIKIELKQIEELENFVLLFEMLHLPGQHEQSFSTIRILLNAIFLPQHKIFVWNHTTTNDLHALQHQQYLSSAIFNTMNIIEVQQTFKQWHDRRLKQTDQQWTIESAINYLFMESIQRFNQATICPLYQMNYSVCYCLALSKLSMIIELDWTLEQVEQYKKFHRDIIIIS
ncbi:unnamed protein product [Rotaria magnacalcarata]|uniref:Uncharacterized protein n=3 Tax=Rotaria magnacalcarata TaxID=392030 RepID=A0A816UVS4_9BILA|nr:unnamed protein product [Rotaria magnacalcarata]CAF1660308.1 unnamed protein product [Rotaria magnacalcarata]CAF2115916.1 unnamed protein product [Rotaria magnacalcarata]CAF2156594.1 unnamed protein product [Rotaria magnacalcarata]CAF4023737.1 unnamed protein product [Rotaria magnacalcarata]